MATTNICPVLTRRPLLTDTVQVTRRVHLQQISDVLQIPIEEIRSLNPQYRRDIIPGNIRPYAAHFAIATGLCFYRGAGCYFCAIIRSCMHDGLAVEPAGLAPGTTVYHKVRKGETLSGIAQKYGVSVSNLRSWN